VEKSVENASIFAEKSVILQSFYIRKSVIITYNNVRKTAIRTSLSNYREEEWMTNVPLYLIGNYFDSEFAAYGF